MRKIRMVEESKKGSPEWMNTYGDLVTLLLTFFALLFSMSQIDIDKFKSVIQSFDGTPYLLDGGKSVSEDMQIGNGITQLPNLEEIIQSKAIPDKSAKETISQDLMTMNETLRELLEEHGLQDKVFLEIQEPYLNLTLLETVMFDSAKATLRPQVLPVLNDLAEILNIYKDNQIKIEGHTDNIPINTYQYPSNWELSSTRAIAVAKYLIQEKRFNPATLSAEGFGEYRPKASNSTKEGRERNRRVEIKILSKYFEY